MATTRAFEPVKGSAKTLGKEIFEGLEPGKVAARDAVGREEGYFRTVDGEKIYWQSWRTKAEEPSGVVLIMHGYGEHSRRYEHVAVALVRAGYEVFALDARGHGKSTGPRGFVERFSRYTDDLSELKRRVRDRFPEVPLFVLGHSNGGLIALDYALRQPEGVSGFLIVSPYLGLAVEVPLAKEAAGKVMSRVFPQVSLPSGLSGDMVSHLPTVIENYDSDALIFDVANSRWFTETTETWGRLFRRAEELVQPFFFSVAGADVVADSREAEKFFHLLGSKDREMEIHPELFHEVLNESEWTEIVTRMLIWMDARQEG